MAKPCEYPVNRLTDQHFTRGDDSLWIIEAAKGKQGQHREWHLVYGVQVRAVTEALSRKGYSVCYWAIV